MKNYQSLLLLLLLGAGLGSCSKIIDLKPQSNVSVENFYKNYSDVKVAVTGCYSGMQIPLQTEWMMTELRSDISKQGSPGSTAVANIELNDLNTYLQNSGHSQVYNYWFETYKNIRSANYVLRSLGIKYSNGQITQEEPTAQLEADQLKQLAGEALFIRAYHYFNLVRLFGGVFILTEAQTPAELKNISRATVEDCYKLIAADLEAAKAFLPRKTYGQQAQEDMGRATVWAAEALLAKVYLTRASTGAAQPDDYRDALDACNRVIGAKIYKLQTTYSDVFDPDKENWSANTAEHIFDVQFDLAPNTGNITIQMQYPIESALIGGAGAGSFKVNPKFVASYAANDSRKAWNVSNQAGSKTLSIYFFYKYRDAKRVGNSSRINWPVLRYADVLLMQSEAINNLNPGDVTKFDGINAVRARAGLSGLDLTTTPNGDAFVDALVNERGWELCLEGHRRFDLLRLGKLKQVQKAVYNRDIDDKYLLFPVPQSEIALDPNLAPNNPGF